MAEVSSLRDRWLPVIDAARAQREQDIDNDQWMELVHETLDAIRVSVDQAFASDPGAETETAVYNLCGAVEGLAYLMTAGAMGMMLKPPPDEPEVVR